MEQRIRYRKVREFGPIFSASFGFIKQNFRSLYGSIFLIAGPFLLIGSTVAGVSFTSFFNESLGSRYQGGNSIMSELIIAYLTSVLVFFIGYSVFLVVLNKAIIEGEKTEDGLRTKFKSISSGLFMSYAWMLGQLLLLGLVLLVAVIFLSLFFGGFFSVLGPMFNDSFFIGMLVIFLTLGFYFVLLPVLTYVAISAMFVCQRDNINIFASIGKTVRYMKDNFWNTWLVGFVSFILYFVLSMLTFLPFYVAWIASFFSRMRNLTQDGQQEGSSSLYLILFMAAIALLGTFSVSIHYIINVFQFGNLEERREGSSVLEKINSFE